MKYRKLIIAILIIIAIATLSGCTNSDVVAVVDEQGDLHTVYSYQPLIGGWTLIISSGGIFVTNRIYEWGSLEDWEGEL